MNREVMSVGNLALMSMLLMLHACSEKPVSSANETENVIQEARKVGAQEYASEALKLAEDQYQKAQEEIAMQDSSFALMRSYKTAEELLSQARMEADKAVIDAKTAKMNAKADAEAAIVLARTTLGEAHILLAQAPRGKGTQADLQALRGDLEAADSISTELDLTMGKEDFLGVQAKAQAIQNLAVRVHDQVAVAMQKAGKAKA